jgi:uncharacterized protein YqeY
MVTERLRAGLRTAITSRDRVAVSALRSALAAIANAEAVEVPGQRGLAIEESPGLGGAEVQRRVLTEADITRIVHTEIADREAAARTYASAGQAERADLLLAEVGVLRGYVAA